MATALTLGTGVVLPPVAAKPLRPSSLTARTRTRYRELGVSPLMVVCVVRSSWAWDFHVPPASR